MSHQHQEFVEGCFGCKLKSLHFGMVPGAYRASISRSNYDKETLPSFPSKEEVMDGRADIQRIEPEVRTFWAKDDETS